MIDKEENLKKQVGKLFIAAILEDGDVQDFYKLGSCQYLFEHVKNEAVWFEFVEHYLRDYGVLPSKSTFEEMVKEKLPEASEPSSFYRDLLYERHVHRSIVVSSDEANLFLNNKEPIKALEKFSEVIKKLERQKIAPDVHDFRYSHDIMMQNITEKIAGSEGLHLGWPTFDSMSGGIKGGDILSAVGRPGGGKTYCLLHAALHGWHEQKVPILFVSMEMTAVQIFERLSAMQTHMPFDWIKKGEFTTLHTDHKKKYADSLLELQAHDVPFYVLDGELAATVSNIQTLCAQFQPGAVFVDGAYLLTAQGYYKSKYEKYGEVCRGLKQHIAKGFDVPVIASWQLNREAKKVKKDSAVGLEHIAGSDEIGQLSSIVLGLTEEDTIQNAKVRKIEILKGRNGEKGQFFINWDFRHMNFSETEDVYEVEIA